MTQLTPAYRWRERGITSFFAVIFAATLLTIIMISFATIMLREQARSSDDELSQSAYDAAMAGVEDAKRAVAMALANGSAMAALNSNMGDCGTIAHVTGAAGSPIGNPTQETLVQSDNTAGQELLQAYTCVTINLNSPDVELREVGQFDSRVVPLRGEGPIDKIVIEWHAKNTANMAGPCGSDGTNLSTYPLCTQSDWSATSSNIPPIVRAQVITPGSGFQLDSLDKDAAGKTVFLYPKALPTVPTNPTVASLAGAPPRYVDVTGDATANIGINRPTTVHCVAGSMSVSEYHCKAEIEAAIPALSDLAILRLSTIYNSVATTNIRVTLKHGTDTVNFNRVQPVVDSTGRANDLYRRVQARLSLAADTDYPEFALDVSGALCKAFAVTPGTVQEIATCNP